MHDSADELLKLVGSEYDLFDRRVRKAVDDDGDGVFDRAERYVYDEAGKRDRATGEPLDDLVLVFDDSGSLKTRYLHGPLVDQVLASEGVAEYGIYWLLADHLGTVRDVAEYDDATDTTSVVNHLAYDSFGNITAETDADQTPMYAFTGRIWVAELGRYNYNRRWLNPRLAQFDSEDPLGFSAGDANTRPLGARFRARAAVGGAASEVDLIRRAAGERGRWAVLVIPLDESVKLAAEGAAVEWDKNIASGQDFDRRERRERRGEGGGIRSCVRSWRRR